MPMTLIEMLMRKPLFAPADEGGSAAADNSAAEGGSGATADAGGNAGTNSAAEDVLAPSRDGKPGDAPDETAETDGAAKDGEDKSEADADDVVPEDGKYEFSDLPEGYEVDEKVAGEVSSIFKEAGLTQKQAALVASKYAALQQEQSKAYTDTVTDTINNWVKEAKQDKEIGGAQWDASVTHANSALEKFGTAELDAALSASGLSNHPEMIRFCARVGAAIADDKFTPGNGGGAEAIPMEQRLYGATTPSGKGA